MTLDQWSESVVISNLLRQNVLRQSWENLLYRYHGAYRPSLVWQLPSARVLCQKLECQDFRPGIQLLVQAAYRLGRLDETPIDSLPGQILQTGLHTPTCDSVPEFRNNDHLDEVLMRIPPNNCLLQPPVNNSPSPDYLAAMVQSPPNLGLERFEFMTAQSTSVTPNIHRSREIQNFNGVTVSGYATEQTQPFPDTPGMAVDHSFSHDPIPDLSRTDFLSNPDTHDLMDAESTHILQQFNYFDFNGFAREHLQRPPTHAGLLRKAKSSMPLSSKKSRSSP